MPNYERKYSVSEIARIFKVERDVVKTWTHHFSDYLKPPANPPKGTPRQFCIDDLRVFAYVFMHWEDDPDLEAIKSGLNTEEHFEQPINEFIATNTPIFMAPPDDLDENWRHGSIIGGMAEYGDTFALADSYKLAGDVLVKTALANDEAYELIYPVIYNYRHATELYLKATIAQQKKDHDLLWLLQEFKKLLKTEFDTALPDWFENIILAFNDFDPYGTAFRYGNSDDFSKHGEVWVDITHMKDRMGLLAEAFQNIRDRRRLTL